MLDGSKECLWILKLNESLEGSLIHLQVEERDMNVSCYNNAIYIYNSIPDFSRSLADKKLLSVVCRGSNFPRVIEESKSGQITVYFRRGVRNEGFNALISVLSCQLGSCLSPYICNANQSCVCPFGFRGANCDIEICPMNCSFSMNHGICDAVNNRCYCNDGFAGEDCSQTVRTSSLVISELFNTQIVTENLHHLKKTLPRFGHTVNADRRGFLWIFGGFSIENGVLNDIRQFDTKNHTWMQVTVDGSDAKMPAGRFFHASAVTKQSIYIYGGLSHNFEFLSDFWMFGLQEQRWMEINMDSIEERPGFLSGHSLTLTKFGDRESFILIGGLSNETSYLNYNAVWEYSLDNSWKKINISGAGGFSNAPIFGHSAVYHFTLQVIYVFGGYQIVDNQLQVSRKLYSLSYKKKSGSWSWSALPVFTELNRPEENLPRPRYFHSALSFSQFMIIYGGESQPSNLFDYLNAYIYKCNSWIRLTENVEIIGKTSSLLTYGSQAVTSVDVDSESNIFYIVGGLDSTFSISKVSLPADICQLWGFSKFLCRLNRGCSFGSISTNNTKKTFCFSSDQKENHRSEVSSAFNHGLVCDEQLLARRNCSTFIDCIDCEAIWPNESSLSCRWCREANCSSSQKRCMSNEVKDNDKYNETIPQSCYWSTDANPLCLTLENASGVKIETKECPKKCSSYKDCSACLSIGATEGGLNFCSWSTKIQRCLSPSSRSLICSGANCGLMLEKNESDQCPISCEFHSMCRKCLQNVHCGWCSRGESLESGEGLCIEGSLELPMTDGIESSQNSICRENFESKMVTNVSDTQFRWNFLHCPPENECTNSHHTCDYNEKCVDQLYGFRCECAQGYQKIEDAKTCIPICTKGCVHGDCVEPDKCRCKFGFVGSNCSIQCHCYGNSDCSSPESLDECLECKNNTIGKQCENCDKFFVGDPKNNVKCVSCLDYCYGHSDTCVPEFNESYSNFSRAQLETILVPGARKNAICMFCANKTDGPRCETCLTGYFRGTTNLNDGCRKCQCNG